MFTRQVWFPFMESRIRKVEMTHSRRKFAVKFISKTYFVDVVMANQISVCNTRQRDAFILCPT